MQLPQSAEVIEASFVPYVPAAHWVQVEEPAAEAYDPGKQLVHDVAPYFSLKVPARHEGHVVPDLYVPGAQLAGGSLQIVDPGPLVVNPATQEVHSTAPAVLE